MVESVLIGNLKEEDMPDGLNVNLLASGIWAIAGVVAGWFVRLFLLDARLTGRWEGTMTCADNSYSEFRSHVFHFTLVLAKPNTGKNSGLLYYQRECTDKSKILRRGVDELTEYSRLKWSLLEPQVLLQFTRRFHIRLERDIDYSNAKQEFNCSIEGVFSESPVLHVKTTLPVDTNKTCEWFGTFKKL